MNIFKKKETIAQNIAFMAIMSAINVIFVLLSNFVPFLIFLLLFILPLSCTLIILLCKKRYFPIYAVTTLGLSFIVSISNISDTLFYVLPSLVTGFVFGVMIEKRIPFQFSLIAATITQFALSYLLMPLVKLITDVNILDTFSKFFNIMDNPYRYNILVFGVFLVSFAQELLCYLFIKYGLKHLNIEPKEITKAIWFDYILIVNLLLLVLSYFIYPLISYIFLYIGAYFTFFIIVRLVLLKKVYINILLAVGAVATVFIFALLYQFIKDPLQLTTIAIYFLFVNILSFINK